MSDESLELELIGCLQENRYLIVMDDVWDVKAWKYLKDLLPDDANGSRILLTCRLFDVAWAIKRHSDPHPLRLLSDEESWMLLEKKVFNDNNCPQELVETGKEIARQCKGFPIAIVALAGLLRMTELSRDSWTNVAEALVSQIIDDPQTRAYNVLELSYNHLPENLKPCFLYLGVLQEDKDILVSKLIRFWLAEGLIPKTEAKSLEDVAEEFLMELINRGLWF
nr:putative late blight resistance protein homolog R1A-10 [Coffea arabica]